jgi:hypothetical protein
MKRTFSVVLIFLVAGLAITIYLMYNHEPTDQAAETPDFKVTTKQLVADFQTDSSASRKKYTDKVVELTGTVKSLDTSGSLVITENGGPAEVIVAIDNRYLPQLKQTAPGSEIVIQGLFSNYDAGADAGDDLLSGLGATMRIRAAGIKRAQ